MLPLWGGGAWRRRKGREGKGQGEARFIVGGEGGRCLAIRESRHLGCDVRFTMENWFSVIFTMVGLIPLLCLLGDRGSLTS